MGAHRKPKTKPTAFAAVVTAAIVVPAGTAAAASYGAFGAPKSDTRGHSAAGFLAVKANSAATSAAKSAIRYIAVTPIPTTSASTSVSAATSPAKPSTQPPKPGSATAPTSAPKASSPSTSQSTSPVSASAPTPPPSQAAPPPPVTARPNQYKNVALSSLEPTGLYGAQQYFTLTADQLTNARTIVAVTEQRGMPLYAAVIATATAMQESSLTNLTYSTNYDSLGLFQQRPSMGWGTAAQVTDPVYATNAFLTALVTYAPNYASQSLWESAQAVQRSGLPTAYAQWEDQAAIVVQSIANGTA